MFLGGITSRPSSGPDDLQRMYDLAAESPGLSLHVADLPWRLSSWSGSNPERTRLWENEAGELVAWAVLQFPWLTLDFEVRPDVLASGIAPVILEWSCDRLAAEAAVRDARLHFFISAREDDKSRIALAERAGFARNDYGYVRLTRDLTEPIPESELPTGFLIRQLDGKREVPAYVATHRAAFGTTSMTEDWRLATLEYP